MLKTGLPFLALFIMHNKLKSVNCLLNLSELQFEKINQVFTDMLSNHMTCCFEMPSKPKTFITKFSFGKLKSVYSWYNIDPSYGSVTLIILSKIYKVFINKYSSSMKIFMSHKSSYSKALAVSRYIFKYI